MLARAVLLGVLFGLCLAQSPTPNPSDDPNVPFCDQVDTHPATGGDGSGASEQPNGSNSNTDTDQNSGGSADDIPNAAQYATDITKIISDLSQDGVSKSVAQFSTVAGQSVLQIQALQARMKDRQAEIDNIFSVVLPAIESAIESRRNRAQVVRQGIVSLNQKLKTLLSSLNRSTYVQEQQAFMTIIDALMRIKNTVDMQAMGGSPYTPRATAAHPSASNALIGLSQNLVDAAVPASAQPETEGDIARLMDALDLLELEAKTQAEESLPYERRASLLLKKISSLLSRLITKFTDLREKHKEFAKTNRQLWSQEIDILQQQADDMTAILETVLDQAQFYVDTYQKHKSHLDALVTAQKQSKDAYAAAQAQLKTIGSDFHHLSQLRASQLRKMNELVHYLTHGSSDYDESVFNFACNGIIDGTARIDACGVCGGGNVTCLDCALTPAGSAEMDVCGVCSGEGRSCRYFCDGIPDSGKIIDLCGSCGGESQACLGCDGVPNSAVELDRCSVCGGDGTSCDITHA